MSKKVLVELEMLRNELELVKEHIDEINGRLHELIYETPLKTMSDFESFEALEELYSQIPTMSGIDEHIELVDKLQKQVEEYEE